MIIIGHRGAAFYEPENTILSFKKAISLKADYIEFDLRKTKDNKVVVIHDNTIDRTSNGNGLVKKFTLKGLRKLDFGKKQRILLLEEVIKRFGKKTGFFIEIKDKNMEKEVVKTLSKHKIKKDFYITSFDPEILRKIKHLNPELKTGLITKYFSLKIIKFCLALKCNFILPVFSSLDNNLVKIAHKTGLKVFTWTIDKKEEYKKAVKLNIDGIATNKPDIE